jgi:hypothetical protein
MRTDGHDEANSAFRNFANAPKNRKTAQRFICRYYLFRQILRQRNHEQTNVIFFFIAMLVCNV